MQIEISLISPNGDYAASDLGFLLHKHPGKVHERDVSGGQATLFFSQASAERATAVLYLELDPIALVRGKGENPSGPLAQYVNDRPYVANSFLSVALGRTLAQSMRGASSARQDLADRALPFEARVTPVAVAGDVATIETLFAPLGYKIDARPLRSGGSRGLFDLRLAGEVRLADLLRHLYVLTPVLDNAKHYWIDRDEISKLLEKGEGWLADHPARELITARALKHRRGLVASALERLADISAEESAEESAESLDSDDETTKADGAEETLEKPIRLHELRLDTVEAALIEHGATSVLDLGCGEGKLLRRLVKLRGVDRILGVDPSTAALERAADRLYLRTAGDTMRQRVTLQMGSLTYGDRRWRGFDAATLVEVIEHVDPPRLSSLQLSLFAEARPRVIVITTPNREYNALFKGMAPGALRHRDHRFEWTRAEFSQWCADAADAFGYSVELRPIGPEDAVFGAPSQMAVFLRGSGGGE